MSPSDIMIELATEIIRNGSINIDRELSLDEAAAITGVSKSTWTKRKKYPGWQQAFFRVGDGKVEVTTIRKLREAQDSIAENNIFITRKRAA